MITLDCTKRLDIFSFSQREFMKVNFSMVFCLKVQNYMTRNVGFILTARNEIEKAMAPPTEGVKFFHFSNSPIIIIRSS